MRLFDLQFSIDTPFEYFKNLGGVSGRLGKYKAWELGHTYYAGCLLDIETKFSIRQDHAGFSVGIGLFGYGINFHIYDTRHWDYETNKWVVYEQSYRIL
jgi:hypothetical protein